VANSYTPGLSLRKPGRGDDYWDDDLNANFDLLEAALGSGSGISGVVGSGLAVSDGGGLSASYTAGSCRLDAARFDIGAGSAACADNALSFLYVDPGGVVRAASSLPSPPYVALALVEASGGSIVRVGDLRRCIVDSLAEHAEDGTHAIIKPASVRPTSTGGGYRRSPGAVYKDPEDRVNNIILKNDATPLIFEEGKAVGFVKECLAASLGSGYVPAHANGLIVCVRAWDTTPGATSCWGFSPWGSSDDEDVRYSAIARVHNPGAGEMYAFYEQLMFRLSPEGKFGLRVHGTSTPTAGIKVRLVGWIEPA
jgi:hypothetical protein